MVELIANILTFADPVKLKNKFYRFPNASRNNLKKDLLLFKTVIEGQRNFISTHAETYKLPKAITKKNLKRFDEALKAIDVLIKSQN